MNKHEITDTSRMWMVLGALVMVELAATYETVMIFSALPKLARVFGDLGAVSWLVTGYLLGGVAITLISSRLGDLLGRTQVLLVVLALMTFGSVLSATTENLQVVIAGRAIQGVAAAIVPLSMGLVREVFPAERVSFCVGVIFGAVGLGSGFGLLMGAVLIDNFHWQYIFVFSAIFSAVSMLLVFLVCPRSPMKREALDGLDIWGAVLLTPALVGLTYGISSAPQHGFLSIFTLSILGGSSVLLALAVRHELLHPTPLIQFRLLATPRIALCNFTYALTALSSLQILLVMTALAQQPVWTGVGLGLSATLAGVIKLPNNVATFAGGLLNGVITSRWGAPASALAGACLLSAAWAFLTVFHAAISHVVVMMVFTGLGLVLLTSGITTVVLQAAPAGRTSEAVGLLNVVKTAFFALGSQVVVMFLNSDTVTGPGGHAYSSAAAFKLTFLIITVCCVGCALLSAMLLWVQTKRASLWPDVDVSPAQ